MLPILNDASQSATEAIDILPMLQSYTIDFTVAFVFGLSLGTNFMLDATARDEWLEAYVLSYPADCMFWLQECAALTKFVQYLGLGDWLLPKGHDAARKFLDDWTLERMRQAEYVFQCNGKSDGSFESGDFPILYDTVKAGFAKSAGLDDCFAPDAQQELELASECFNHIRKSIGIVTTKESCTDVQPLQSLPETPLVSNRTMTVPSSKLNAD